MCVCVDSAVVEGRVSSNFTEVAALSDSLTELNVHTVACGEVDDEAKIFIVAQEVCVFVCLCVSVCLCLCATVFACVCVCLCVFV